MKDCYIELNHGDSVMGARICNWYVFTVTRPWIGRDRVRVSILDRARM
jgi:hypothetical protein